MGTSLDVLLIEDNLPDARLVEEYIADSETSEIRLARMENLESGVEKAMRKDVQVVLLDLDLPGTSGVQTLERFRRQIRDIPVIVFTDLADEQVAVEAVEYDAEDYLVKSNATSFSLICAIRYAIERSRKREELIQSRKLEALGKLAGGIAHDFNNLMTGVIGYAELIRQELAEEEDLQSDLTRIIEAGQQASDLTDQILAFSRQKIMEPEVKQINDLVGGMEDMLRGALPEIIDLSFSFEEDTGSVLIDSSRFKQVIFNLAINARDAMPEGGDLDISTRNEYVSETKARGHPEACSGSYVVVSVADTGVGIDEETQKKIFEPFFSTKRKKEGTGLGLSTALGTVTQSNGHIWVSSEKGEGTTMEVYLPRTSELSEPDQAQFRMQSAFPGDGQKILVVEDEKVVREFVAKALVNLGYHVSSVGTADEAFELLDEGELEGMKLLISDVVLPDLRGDILVRELAEELPGVGVLLITGYAEELRDFDDEGMAQMEVMTKPFTVEKLGERINSVLNEMARKM